MRRGGGSGARCQWQIYLIARGTVDEAPHSKQSSDSNNDKRSGQRRLRATLCVCGVCAWCVCVCCVCNCGLIITKDPQDTNKDTNVSALVSRCVCANCARCMCVCVCVSVYVQFPLGQNKVNSVSHCGCCCYCCCCFNYARVT